MGFVGYPKVKLLTRPPYFYKDHINSFSLVAAQAQDVLSKRPALEDTVSGDTYKDLNFLHFDPLIGANGAVMLPPIYDEENTMLTMNYKVHTGQQIRELIGTDYSEQDVFDGSIPSNIDDIVGVYEGERYEPYTGVLDGVDYSLSSQQWEEVWAERVKKRERTSDEEEVEDYYIDNYRVKVHQDMIKEDVDARDPVLIPPSNTAPDLHFCLKRQKQYPPMPTGLNEEGEIEGLQVFWVEISKGPATPSQQAEDEEIDYPTDTNYTESSWKRFDVATEEPFISIGFGAGSNNRRIEIVFPVSKTPYAVFWYQEEGKYSRRKNVILPLNNAVPVMASAFNVFVYVMLGEIAIRVTNADMSAVIWEDKIIDRGQSDPEKRYLRILGAAPYVRGKNMQCTVGISRLKFKKSAVGYTPTIHAAVEAQTTDVEYNLHGAYEYQYHILPVDETYRAQRTDAEDYEPTEDTATGDKVTTFSYVPRTVIYSYMRSQTRGKFKEFYWLVVLVRHTDIEYITPLLFTIEATAPPVPADEPPDWVDITDLLIKADISQSAPDYYSIDQYLTLQLRDDNFIEAYDEEDVPIYENSYDYFSEGAKEIKLYAGWHTDDPDGDQSSSVLDLPDLTEIFTGFVTNVSLDYIAELNIVNLKVSHMIERMKNTPILLSPFYDGMKTSGVIKDLVKRGQLFSDESPKEPNVIFVENDEIVTEFVDTMFYLGVGKDYQSPVAKFGGDEMIMDCIRDIAAKDGARVYGHPNGALVYQKSSQGQVDDTTPVATFYSYPSTGAVASHSEYFTMFSGLTFERTPHESFNEIQLITVERDLRVPIVEGYPKLDANGEKDFSNVGYLKIYRRKDPALGDHRSARITVRKYAFILFYPPRKASFDALGHPELLPIQCISIWTSKGYLGKFRIVSISSSISKDDNEFKYEASYEVDWQNA